MLIHSVKAAFSLRTRHTLRAHRVRFIQVRHRMAVSCAWSAINVVQLEMLLNSSLNLWRCAFGRRCMLKHSTVLLEATDARVIAFSAICYVLVQVDSAEQLAQNSIAWIVSCLQRFLGRSFRRQEIGFATFHGPRTFAEVDWIAALLKIDRLSVTGQLCSS